jgi:hypothetical protein
VLVPVAEVVTKVTFIVYYKYEELEIQKQIRIAQAYEYKFTVCNNTYEETAYHMLVENENYLVRVRKEFMKEDITTEVDVIWEWVKKAISTN